MDNFLYLPGLHYSFLVLDDHWIVCNDIQAECMFIGSVTGNVPDAHFVNFGRIL